MIRAEVHSDDYKVEAKFDATKWFEQAIVNEIMALRMCDFGGDSPADAVALFMAEYDPQVARVFDYLEFKPTMPYSNDSVGFECHVDADDAIAWLSENQSNLALSAGDYARNVESGWLGKIVAFERDNNLDWMAKMVGVDVMATHIAGLSQEESLSEDDVQWHSPGDLVPAGP